MTLGKTTPVTLTFKGYKNFQVGGERLMSSGFIFFTPDFSFSIFYIALTHYLIIVLSLPQTFYLCPVMSPPGSHLDWFFVSHRVEGRDS